MSNNLAPLFVKGIDENIYTVIKGYEATWKKIFHVHPTKARYIDHQTWAGYGLPQARVPGERIADGQFAPSFSKHYVIRNFGLKDSFPDEDIADDLYGVINRVIPAKAGLFARTFMDLLELDTANLLSNQGFASGTNVAGSPDGRSLFSTVHPISVGQSAVTVANRPLIEVDMSVAGAQAAAVAIRLQKAPNNITVIPNEVAKVVYNPGLTYIAHQVYKGKWEPNTANRNDNVLNQKHVELVEWPYWNKSGAQGVNNAWFVLGKMHNLHFFMRQGVRPKSQSDIVTNSIILAATCRFDEGWTDYRGTWGTTGL